MTAADEREMAAKVAAARFHPDAHVVATFSSVIR